MATAKSAESIREYVAKHYIEPARRAGEHRVRVIAGDVHRSLGLKNRVPSVCQVLDSRKFCEDSHARGDQLGASVFKIGKISAGAYKSGRLTEAQQIKEFFGGGEVRFVQFGTDAAERYAFIRASHNLSPAMRLISPPPPSLMSMFT